MVDSGRAWVRSALPVSAAVSRASSSVAASKASAMRSNAFCRSLKCSARQAGKAALAALTARSASTARPSGTRANMVPRRPGDSTSVHSPPSASTHSPPISIGRSGILVVVLVGVVTVEVNAVPLVAADLRWSAGFQGAGPGVDQGSTIRSIRSSPLEQRRFRITHQCPLPVGGLVERLGADCDCIGFVQTKSRIFATPVSRPGGVPATIGHVADDPAACVRAAFSDQRRLKRSFHDQQ